MDPNSLALKSKLPIKRKTPSPSPSPLSPPPFKFHRIWTEHDEIRFLQGLLSPPSLSLSFPRDLNTFYSRFSLSMSQPYTKSQLSEKLRRLRKKFRVINTRLIKGLDPSLLSPHDRDLYTLSEQLWHPDFASTSPFSTSNCGTKNDCEKLIGVKVEFSLDFDIVKCLDGDGDGDGNGNEEVFRIEDGGEGKLSEVDVKFEDCIENVGCNGSDECEKDEAAGGAVKIVMSVFDEVVEEVRKGIVNGEGEGEGEGDDECRFEKRWQEQCGAELDVFAQRMRLILESSIPKVSVDR